MEQLDDVPQRLGAITLDTTRVCATDCGESLRDTMDRSASFVVRPEYISMHNRQIGWPDDASASLRIGVISIPLDDDILVNDSDPSYSLWAIRPYPLSEIKDRLKYLIAQACEKNCQFIVLNELAYPIDSISRKISSEIDRNQKVRSFLDELRCLEDIHPRYFVAGSFHDPVKKYNVSPIAACTQNGLNDRLYLHAKRTSAVRERERVRLLSERVLNLYRTAYGNLAVMICLDFYDASQILSLLLHNDRCDESDCGDAARVDILAVPSLGMKKPEAVVKAVAQVSLLLGSIVAFAQSNSHGSEQWVYVAGQPARIVHEAQCHGGGAAGGSSGPVEMTVFEISGQEYLSARAEAKEKRKALRAFLSPPRTTQGDRASVMTIT